MNMNENMNKTIPMNIQLILKQLKNFRKKWRTNYTKEGGMANALFAKGANASAEKSVGITIGYGMCTHDIDKLIKQIERENP